MGMVLWIQVEYGQRTLDSQEFVEANGRSESVEACVTLACLIYLDRPYSIHI